MIPLVGALFEIGKEFVTDWRQEKANKRKIKAAVAENKIRLAQSEQTHNQQWEMTALEGRDTFLRRFSFSLLTFPLIWAGFDPEGAQQYFTEALGALPDWYVWAYTSVLGAIWGLTELRRLKR